jgi:hypothetical protein
MRAPVAAGVESLTALRRRRPVAPDGVAPTRSRPDAPTTGSRVP